MRQCLFIDAYRIIGYKIPIGMLIMGVGILNCCVKIYLI